MPRLTALAILGVVLSLAAGCARPVTLGKAPASSPPLHIAVSPPGPVHPEQWPNACTFLTDGDLDALLPGHEKVERTPEPVTVLDLDLLSDDNLTGDADNGSCDYLVRYRADRSIKITVTIATVGAPGIIRAQHKKDFAAAIERKMKGDFVRSVDIAGAAGCYRYGRQLYSSLRCHQGPLGFKVSTSGYVEIEGVPGDPDKVLEDRLQPEVVKAIAGRLG